MEPSRIDVLSPREAEVLRALWRLGAVDAVARELDRSTETVRTQLKAARNKLGADRSIIAARMLAEAEALHPSLVTPPWATARGTWPRERDAADDGSTQLVRDVADWSIEPPGASRNVGSGWQQLRRVLDDGAIRAVTFAALIALIIFALTKLPHAISNTTFEPAHEPPATAGSG